MDKIKESPSEQSPALKSPEVARPSALSLPKRMSGQELADNAAQFALAGFQGLVKQLTQVKESEENLDDQNTKQAENQKAQTGEEEKQISKDQTNQEKKKPKRFGKKSIADTSSSSSNGSGDSSSSIDASGIHYKGKRPVPKSIKDKYPHGQWDNTTLSKLISDDLIKTVTQVSNQVEFETFKQDVKLLIMKIIEKPVRKVEFLEQLVHKLNDQARRNGRQIGEFEYIIQRYQRSNLQVDEFDNRLKKMQQKLNDTCFAQDKKLQEMETKVKVDIPDMVNSNKKEIESWQRWFVRTQREFEDLRFHSQTFNQQVTTQLRQHMTSQIKNLEEVHENQLELERDGTLLKNHLTEQQDTLTELNVKLQVFSSELVRKKREFDAGYADMAKKLEKAEADRMDKYYRQVSELQDWVFSVKDDLNMNSQMNAAMQNYFNTNFQICQFNSIAEAMIKCLEGRQLNKFLDFMRDKQNYLGKKRLMQLNNSKEDGRELAIRNLNSKQPFQPLPGPIPEDELPPDFNDIMNRLTQQMGSMQKQSGKKRSPKRRSSKQKLQGAATFNEGHSNYQSLESQQQDARRGSMLQQPQKKKLTAQNSLTNLSQNIRKTKKARKLQSSNTIDYDETEDASPSLKKTHKHRKQQVLSSQENSQLVESDIVSNPATEESKNKQIIEETDVVAELVLTPQETDSKPKSKTKKKAKDGPNSAMKRLSEKLANIPKFQASFNKLAQKVKDENSSASSVSSARSSNRSQQSPVVLENKPSIEIVRPSIINQKDIQGAGLAQKSVSDPEEDKQSKEVPELKINEVVPLKLAVRPLSNRSNPSEQKQPIDQPLGDEEFKVLPAKTQESKDEQMQTEQSLRSAVKKQKSKVTPIGTDNSSEESKKSVSNSSKHSFKITQTNKGIEISLIAGQEKSHQLKKSTSMPKSQSSRRSKHTNIIRSSRRSSRVDFANINKVTDQAEAETTSQPLVIEASEGRQESKKASQRSKTQQQQSNPTIQTNSSIKRDTTNEIDQEDDSLRIENVESVCTSQSQEDLLQVKQPKKKNRKKKASKHKKKKQQRSDDEDSDSSRSSGSSSNNESSGSFSSENVFGKRHEDWARTIMEDLREEWKLEDGQLYVTRDDRDTLLQKVQIMEEKAESIEVINASVIENHEMAEQNNKDVCKRLDELKRQLINCQNDFRTEKAKTKNQRDQNEKNIADLNARFSQQTQDMFNDFVLKVESELARRNRLKIEIYDRFDRMDQHLNMVQNEINRFDQNQKEVLGSIKKCMYVADIQTSLNIQDELDREWVSLFGALEKTGARTVVPTVTETGATLPRSKAVNHEKSHFTLNKDCISCTGNMEQKLNLFKVACLDYQANPVSYQGKRIDRRELISLQKVVSDLAKQSLESTKDEVQHHIGFRIPSSNNIRSGDMSPERTTAEQSQDLLSNSDILIAPVPNNLDIAGPMLLNEDQQQINDDNSVSRVESANESQLTVKGLSKARNLVEKLKFHDQQLQDLYMMQSRREEVHQTFFNVTKDEITAKRNSSAYKRKFSKQMLDSYQSQFVQNSFMKAPSEMSDVGLGGTHGSRFGRRRHTVEMSNSMQNLERPDPNLLSTMWQQYQHGHLDRRVPQVPSVVSFVDQSLAPIGSHSCELLDRPMSRGGSPAKSGLALTSTQIQLGARKSRQLQPITSALKKGLKTQMPLTRPASRPDSSQVSVYQDQTSALRRSSAGNQKVDSGAGRSEIEMNQPYQITQVLSFRSSRRSRIDSAQRAAQVETVGSEGSNGIVVGKSNMINHNTEESQENQRITDIKGVP